MNWWLLLWEQRPHLWSENAVENWLQEVFQSSGTGQGIDCKRCVLREALKLMFFPQLLCKWPCWRDALFGLGGLLSVRNLTVVCKLSNLHGAENHNVFSSFPVSKKCNYHSFTALIMGFLKLIWMLSKSSMPACKGEILTKLWIYSTSSRGCEKLYPVRSNALYWSYRRDKSHGLKLKWYGQEKSIIILKIDIFFLFFY